MKRLLALLACATPLLLSACNTAGDTSNAPPWIRLFDGESLDGWTPKFSGHALGVNLRDTYRVEDGKLVVSYADWDEFDGAFGHLFFEREFSHYVLRLEYRFVGDALPGAPGWAVRNNGVMFHGQPAETMGLDQDFPCSIEAQLLGGLGAGARPTGNVCTPGTHVHTDGELMRAHVIDFGGPTIDGDEWVEFELEVHGAELVVHRVNGVEVARYGGLEIDPEDERAGGAAEARRRGTTELASGTISLQAETHGIEFRDIRLRPLPVRAE